MTKSTIYVAASLCLVATLSSLATTAFSPVYHPLKPLVVSRIMAVERSTEVTTNSDSNNLESQTVKNESSAKEERKTLRQKVANRLAKIKNFFWRRKKNTGHSSVTADVPEEEVVVEEIKSTLSPTENPRATDGDKSTEQPKPNSVTQAVVSTVESTGEVELVENDTKVLQKNESSEKTGIVSSSQPATGLLDKAETAMVGGGDGKAAKLEKKTLGDMMQKVKEAGKAGIVSYALWELAFWLVSIPISIAGYYEFAGHFPDFSNSEDMAYLGGEAFALVNFARFALPLRIGLALSTAGWVGENIVDRFFPEDKK